MESLRIILFLFITVLSLYNLITYLYKKNKLNKAAEISLKEMQPVREISSEESIALKNLYGKEISPGSPVFEISGPYSASVIRTNGSSVTTHFIGNFEVTADGELAKNFQEENTGEIVFHKKKRAAYILKLNGIYNCLKESELKSFLKSGTETDSPLSGSMETDEGSIRFGNRELTVEEKTYLNRDMRILPSLGAFLSLLALIFIPSIIAALPGSLMLLFSLILLFSPRAPFSSRLFGKKLMTLKGMVENQGTDNYPRYYMGRFELIFPSWWKSSVQPGKIASVEAYPMDKGLHHLKVLSLDSITSIQRDSMSRSFASYSRFYLLSVLILIDIILFLTAGDGVDKIENLYRYYATSGLQKEFDSFEEIASYDFSTGQEVEFTNVKTFPASRYGEDGSIWINGKRLAGAQEEIVLDLQMVESRLGELISFQKTSEMINLSAFRANSNEEYYNFLLMYLTIAENRSFADFEDVFHDNEEFSFLQRMVDYFFHDVEASPDPEMEALSAEDITGAIDSFLTREQAILNDLTGRAMKKAEPDVESFTLNLFNFDSVDFNLRPQDLMVFSKSNDYFSNNDIQYYDTVPAVAKLSQLKAYYENNNRPVAVSGIVESFNRSDDTGSFLDIYPERNYSDMSREHIAAGTGLILLLLFLASFMMIVTGIMKRRG
ncbi:hypothetical protein [Spirochaeta isovalerica]|uniref:Intracellular growth attenuator protein IgaA n=1 Tax=Spirochaeta isovalerica TaxID=150 RepID=A0A841RH42_9SPIO|nr:hypothetical protein [Spirochaeta isovalerica]MBB6481632.1 hypothetical protein [Spirochaeta isovalerica]